MAGGFDHVPDQAVETRKKLFDRAIADKTMVAGLSLGPAERGHDLKGRQRLRLYTCSVIVKRASLVATRPISEGRPQTSAPLLLA